MPTDFTLANFANLCLIVYVIWRIGGGGRRV